MKSLHTFLLVLCTIMVHAQSYTRQDSLRGTITPERIWWDLGYYHLDIIVDIESQMLRGTNTIRYRVSDEQSVMQIDLQPPMRIQRVTQDGKELLVRQDGNAHFVELVKKQIPGEVNTVMVHYEGKPREAPNPPWDSGMVWKEDDTGKPFASSISWGAGSSQWWPCKDHMYDEVDSMLFSINVRNDLVAVGNGRLTKIEKKRDGTRTFNWFISNPVNSYGVNFNLGNYVSFSESYQGENGPLSCEYYVLEQNLDKARDHFMQVASMLEAFEYWFGPYPFYEDGYKVVEVPYLGMEHQSATAYGNGYQNGYLGKDLSMSGWGLKFDNILIHESGHEWFACNITFKDVADIWIHESFTTYSEGLFVEYHYGKQAGDDYQVGLRGRIMNDRPLIGNYGVNDLAYSGDNYPKGAAMLHMLRQLVKDDDKWRQILRGLNTEFYHQTVTTQQIERYISAQAGLDLEIFFDQYLRTSQIPVFEYYSAGDQLSFRWTNCLPGFDMPLRIDLNGEEQWIRPLPNWQMIAAGKISNLTVDRNFYVPVFYSNPRD